MSLLSSAAHAAAGTPAHAVFPPNGGHDADCAYVGGIGPNCTCTDPEATR